MLRSYRVLTGYTRLKNMADLEKRLVRKLGASDEGFTVSDVRNLINSRLLHTGRENMPLHLMATNNIRCIAALHTSSTTSIAVLSQMPMYLG